MAKRQSKYPNACRALAVKADKLSYVCKTMAARTNRFREYLIKDTPWKHNSVFAGRLKTASYAADTCYLDAIAASMVGFNKVEADCKTKGLKLFKRAQEDAVKASHILRLSMPLQQRR